MRFEAVAAWFALALALAGCGAQPVARTDSHMQPDAVRPAGNIPEPVRGIPMPPAPASRDAEIRYSVVVADQPVREVLMAMARETKINFDIDPRVEGTVNLNAIDQTLKQILNRMAKQVDMRWETDGTTITVMRDTPYLRNYRVDYVNMSRDTTETSGIATQVISGSLTASVTAGATTTAGGNNSTITVNSVSRQRFWETLERNIKDMLRETDKLLPEGSSETFVQNRGQAATSSSAARTSTGEGLARSGTEGPGDTQTALNTERVESRLTFREAASVIVNPESGIVSVRGTSRQHEKVQEFLTQVASSARRQVLIEATIVEVTLNDNYQSGVDWSALAQQGLGYSIQQSFLAGNLTTPPFFSISYSNPNAAKGGSIASTVKLLETYGQTRVLSSPKLMLLNNQTAMMKVVDNQVYFTIKTDTIVPGGTAGNVTNSTSTQNVVPVGFLMNVTAQISDTDMVTLNVRPTITRIIDNVQDPNPSLVDARGNVIKSLVPVTQTRELESVLRVSSGQTAVLGGLMLDSFVGHRDGIPIASRIPFFGDFVSFRNDTSTKSELVIFVRPLVIRDASIDGDLAAYRTQLPNQDFFRTGEPPYPRVQRGIERLENLGMPKPAPDVKAVPIVPDAPPPPAPPR